MLQFTTVRGIASRFNVPRSRVEVFHQGRGNFRDSTRRRIFDLIDRVRPDPDRKYLLTHPKIWQYARIQELAPQHAVSEIRSILLREKAGMPHLAAVKILSDDSIGRIIRTFHLRTREELHRISRFPRNARPKNSLSQTERQLLVHSVLMMLHGHDLSRTRFSDPELDDYIHERINKEAERFPFPVELSSVEREKLFKQVVRARLRYWLKDGLRTKGPYTRSGKRRDTAQVEEFESRLPASNPFMDVSIPPGVSRKLKRRELFTVMHLLEGYTLRDVAQKLSVSLRTASNYLIRALRKI